MGKSLNPHQFIPIMAKARKRPGRGKPKRKPKARKPKARKPRRHAPRVRAVRRHVPKARKRPPHRKAKRRPLPKPRKKAVPKARKRVKPHVKRAKPPVKKKAKPLPKPAKKETIKAIPILLPKPQPEPMEIAAPPAPAEVEGGIKPEEAPPEEKEEKAPEEAPAEKKPEGEAPPEGKEGAAPEEEPEKKKKKKPEEELTPEEKIEQLFPEEEAAEAPPEKKEEAAPAEEKPPEAPPEEKAPPEEGKPKKKKAAKEGRELTPEEKIEQLFPEEEAAPAEEKPAEAPAAEKEEAPVEAPAEEAPEEAPPEPLPPKAEEAAPVEVAPALEMLPKWEDRRRLDKAIEEGKLAFYIPPRKSAASREAMRLLAEATGQAADANVPGYSIVCAKGKTGRLVGAADFHIMEEGGVKLLIMARSAVSLGTSRRDMHSLLYACALAAAKPTHVVCRTARPDLSRTWDVGRLIFFGRGLGMCAMPLKHPRMLYFIRRIGKEGAQPMSGQRLAMMLGMANAAYKDKLVPELAGVLAKGEAVALIMLPASPDYGEHLHELKDAVMALGLPTAKLDASLGKLESRYLRGRADITPASLF